MNTSTTEGVKIREVHSKDHVKRLGLFVLSNGPAAVTPEELQAVRAMLLDMKLMTDGTAYHISTHLRTINPRPLPGIDAVAVFLDAAEHYLY